MTSRGNPPAYMFYVMFYSQGALAVLRFQTSGLRPGNVVAVVQGFRKLTPTLSRPCHLAYFPPSY
jgi:hypothetical protein